MFWSLLTSCLLLFLQVDTYGTQQPIALLRFVMERMFLYARGKDLDKIILKDVHFLAAMNPPGNGRNFIDPRAVSRFFCFNINSPSQGSIKTILSTILEMKFGTDCQSLKASATRMHERARNASRLW